MKPNVTLTITSLLSILLVSFHFADDIARGIEPGRFGTITALLILVVWLCGPDARRTAIRARHHAPRDRTPAAGGKAFRGRSLEAKALEIA